MDIHNNIDHRHDGAKNPQSGMCFILIVQIEKTYKGTQKLKNLEKGDGCPEMDKII